MRPSFRVYVDFDGTIARSDTTDELLERFAEPQWEEIETAWLAGKIGSAECMRRQIECLRVRPEALHRFAATVEIDPAFAGFVRLCRRYGLPVAVVSDGLDLVIHGALRANGIALPVFANHLTWDSDDRWSLTSPHALATCEAQAGVCKCARLAPQGADHTASILIGDGRSDYCGAETADHVFAKASLLDRCRTLGIPHDPFEDFAGMTQAFGRFIEERTWPSIDDRIVRAPLRLVPA